MADNQQMTEWIFLKSQILYIILRVGKVLFCSLYADDNERVMLITQNIYK